MIENELRALFADRVGDLSTNGRRTAEVRARIKAARRRRATGAALAVVLVALAGALLTRLPGRPDALPTGVPPGPWFTTDGVPAVPGYTAPDIRDVTGPTEHVLVPAPVRLRYLLLVRCERPGTFVLRNLGPAGATAEVDCSYRAGDRFEGVTALDPAAADRLFSPSGADSLNVRYEPGSPGTWTVAVLWSTATVGLRPPDAGRPPLLDGATSPDGGTFEATVPPRAAGVGLVVSVDCVPGVKLELSVPGGVLGTVDCDPTRDPARDVGAMSEGRISLYVPDSDVDRVDLRPGQRTRITVRSTGIRTGEWRIVSAS